MIIPNIYQVFINQWKRWLPIMEFAVCVIGFGSIQADGYFKIHSESKLQIFFQGNPAGSYVIFKPDVFILSRLSI
jgi:hypothetical protein